MTPPGWFAGATGVVLHRWPRATLIPGQTGYRLSLKAAWSSSSSQSDEKLVQLVELLRQPGRRPGVDRSVESFLRGVEIVHDQPCLAAPLLEGHGRDGPTVIPF